MDLKTIDAPALAQIERDAADRYADLRRRNIQIDMTRGKPAPEQLDLSDPMLTAVGPGDCIGEDGTDYRNYGIWNGIPEARRFFAAYLEAASDEVVVGGNSAIAMMYDALARAVFFGLADGDGPWRDQAGVKMLCTVPGYDRHFRMCEQLGLEMIPVELTETGPDMDRVEALVADDAAVKGLICVPKYSNPSGITYADAAVDRLAAMRTAAPDFRIFWDNAYAYHHHGAGPAPLKNILEACKAAGTENRPLIFGSTSKITYAAGGVAAMAASRANIADAYDKIFGSTVGPEKINQLRHVRFFGDLDGMLAHMERHAVLIAPKFAAVDAALEHHLGGKGLATWSKPTGGYFVGVDVMPGCAAEVVRLAGEAGVKLTEAGALYPYGRDPRDSTLRIAPTMPPLEEIEHAMAVFCACVELACLQKLKSAA
ncbi:MAG: aminotransferase [Hyphomicrobiales bacterium]|nr:aminotransferase [Hyphomicrobiales bacterium]